MDLRFDRRLAIALALGFVVSTVVGTLGHEGGHFLVALLEGHRPRMNYATTFLLDAPEDDGGLPFVFGGPLETMGVGTFGVLWLWATRAGFAGAERLAARQWLVIFLALHWLRQPANLAAWVTQQVMRRRADMLGDEIRIARHLHLPEPTVLAVTAALGTAVLAWVTFRVVPRPERLTFLVAGLGGGTAGAVLWFGWLGPVLLP
jgi:hypothetical protein